MKTLNHFTTGTVSEIVSDGIRPLPEFLAAYPNLSLGLTTIR